MRPETGITSGVVPLHRSFFLPGGGRKAKGIGGGELALAQRCRSGILQNPAFATFAISRRLSCAATTANGAGQREALTKQSFSFCRWALLRWDLQRLSGRGSTLSKRQNCIPWHLPRPAAAWSWAIRCSPASPPMRSVILQTLYTSACDPTPRAIAMRRHPAFTDEPRYSRFLSIVPFCSTRQNEAAGQKNTPRHYL